MKQLMGKTLQHHGFQGSCSFITDDTNREILPVQGLCQALSTETLPVQSLLGDADLHVIAKKDGGFG